MKIAAAHRELFIDILSNPGLKAALYKDDFKLTNVDIVGTFIINHVYNLFYYHKMSLIETDGWENLMIDIKDTFTWKLVSDRWKTNKCFYSEEFQNFIDKLICLISHKIFKNCITQFK